MRLPDRLLDHFEDEAIVVELLVQVQGVLLGGEAAVELLDQRFVNLLSLFESLLGLVLLRLRDLDRRIEHIFCVLLVDNSLFRYRSDFLVVFVGV